jgi:hypothetical protein
MINLAPEEQAGAKDLNITVSREAERSRRGTTRSN